MFTRKKRRPANECWGCHYGVAAHMYGRERKFDLCLDCVKYVKQWHRRMVYRAVEDCNERNGAQ